MDKELAELLRLRRFVDQEKVDEDLLKYYAGRVRKIRNGGRVCYAVTRQQYGAQATFSVGQPVYNEGGELLGWLGIGLYDHLDYSSKLHGDVRCPDEFWEINLPTKACKDGTPVVTYWQEKSRGQSDRRS